MMTINSIEEVNSNSFIKRNMALIVGSSGLGIFADSIYTLCIAWYVLDTTNSAFFTSLIYTITFIVNVFLGPFIGVIVDRTNPKAAMIKSYVILALVGLIVSSFYFTNKESIIVIILLMVIVNDVAQAFINPSVGRLLPRLVGMNKVAIANGYMSSTDRTAAVFGRAVAGLLFSLIGFVGVMITHSVVFIVAAILVSWLVLPSDEDTIQKKKVLSTKNYLTEFIDGIKVLKAQKNLLILSLTNMGINVISIGHLYIVMFKNEYGATATEYGILEATAIGASIFAGVIVGKITKKFKPVLILSLSNVIAGFCMVLIGFNDNLIIAAFLLSIQMMCGVFYGVVFGTLLITLVEAEFRARVDSLVISISALIMPITVLLSGYLADLININFIFYVAGIWVILISALPLLSKDMRKIKKLIEN